MSKFAVYLSHSWEKRDVAFNLWVWDKLAPVCDLLVDKPVTQEKDPPYYISRLEELMRRCDVFTAVLTHRAAARSKQRAKPAGDGQLACSPWSLFEIRLAERANRPRLVLYERSTAFRRPVDTPGITYVVFDRGPGDELPADLERIEQSIKDWLEWLKNHPLASPRWSLHLRDRW